jgi:hypothetical protein
MVGASSDDIRAETTVVLGGAVRELDSAALVPTAVAID